MADIARLAGVSTMTVSNAFSQPDRVSKESRERVQRAAKELNYAGPDPAARSLRRGRTGNIGVAMGEHLPYAFVDAAASRFLAGVADVCVQHQTGMLLIPVSGGASDVDRVRAAAVDGYVFWSVADRDKGLDAAVATGRPVATQGGPHRKDTYRVAIDNRASARAAGDLVFAGRRRPAIVALKRDNGRRAELLFGPDPRKWSFSVSRHRLLGLRDALGAAGWDWNDVPVVITAYNDRVASRDLLDRLFKECGPDAVVAMSDELAVGVLEVLRRRGLESPDDVAVCGWDDDDSAEAAGLTTIHHSLYDQGVRCAHAALGDEVDSSEVPWKVVRRRTTR